MLTTTLNKILARDPCGQEVTQPLTGWLKLLKHLGKTQADDEPLPFSVIVESNGLEDALWCCQSAPEYNEVWRVYARWCALQVINLWDAPEVVLEYLNTGNENIRKSALADACVEQEKEFLGIVS